jgi:hypothetical protein
MYVLSMTHVSQMISLHRIALKCNYRSSDGRVAAPNKQAVEASKLLLDTLQAENDALRRCIQMLKSGSIPANISNDSSVTREDPTDPGSDAEIEALANQTRHLVVCPSRSARPSLTIETVAGR